MHGVLIVTDVYCILYDILYTLQFTVLYAAALLYDMVILYNVVVK